MKKSVKTQENVNAVEAQVESKPKRPRKQKEAKTEQKEVITAEQDLFTEQPKPKAQKFVDVKFDASVVAVHTEKAQLVKFMKDETEVKIWLPISQIELSQDTDNPNIHVIHMAAWLYFKSGLNNVAPVARWTSQKAEQAEQA